jgi:hypothetical protein
MVIVGATPTLAFNFKFSVLCGVAVTGVPDSHPGPAAPEPCEVDGEDKKSKLCQQCARYQHWNHIVEGGGGRRGTQRVLPAPQHGAVQHSLYVQAGKSATTKDAEPNVRPGDVAHRCVQVSRVAVNLRETQSTFSFGPSAHTHTRCIAGVRVHTVRLPERTELTKSTTHN